MRAAGASTGPNTFAPVSRVTRQSSLEPNGIELRICLRRAAKLVLISSRCGHSLELELLVPVQELFLNRTTNILSFICSEERDSSNCWEVLHGIAQK
jgi:hypothetical protein